MEGNFCTLGKDKNFGMDNNSDSGYKDFDMGRNKATISDL